MTWTATAARQLPSPCVGAMRALALCLICAVAEGQVEGPPAPQIPQQPAPQLGKDLAALAGNTALTFGELDELLLWRYGQSPDGLAAL